MSPKRKVDRSEEVLRTPVNLDGAGEDQVIKDLVSDKFSKGTNQEALDIGLALQTIIRGQTSLLENQQQFSDELNRLRARMDQMDKAANKWDQDRENFIQEVLDRSEKLIATGIERDKIIAKGSAEYTHAIENAKAEQITDQLKFEQALASAPKVMVVSPGELVMVVEGGRQVAKIMNETVKIKHKKWVLPAGRAVEVPLPVAQVLEQRRRTQQETAAREQALAANLETSKLDAKWREINSTYNSTTDALPSV